MNRWCQPAFRGIAGSPNKLSLLPKDLASALNHGVDWNCPELTRIHSKSSGRMNLLNALENPSTI